MREDAIERERQFHNERFSQATDPRAGLNKWYASIWHGEERYNELVRQRAKNKAVLEYGCADGRLSLRDLKIHEECDSFIGIDISDVAIKKATEQALALKNVSFLTMDAEAMTFTDHSFDLVFGQGIMHHLNLKKCFGEVSRVLRKNGVAIFYEPMGHNPIINLYRSKTPHMRTADEHPLLMADFALARRYFARVDTTFYGLFSLASVFLDATANGIPYRLLKTIDDFVLRIPTVGRYAWFCLIVCHKY